MDYRIAQIREAAEYVQAKSNTKPKLGIILGSGLGGLVKEIQDQERIPYHEIPHFPVSTVEGHRGELILGSLAGQSTIVMNGRFHYYEDYSLEQVVFPLRVMRLLGVERLIVTNAAGGLNPDYTAGDLMLIDDFISLLPDNPLRGKNLDEFGPRFPDMSEPIDPDWRKRALEVAKSQGLHLQKGVYIGVTGPSLETKAEIRMFRILGGDAVGMSTVSELIVAHQMGMKVIAFSVITNESIPKVAKTFSHQDVVAMANQAGEKLVRLVKGIV
jgi:purine-nucleoside phosphorylase